MLETSKTVAIIFVVALLIQFCVERVKELDRPKSNAVYQSAFVVYGLCILFAFMFHLMCLLCWASHPPFR